MWVNGYFIWKRDGERWVQGFCFFWWNKIFGLTPTLTEWLWVVVQQIQSSFLNCAHFRQFFMLMFRTLKKYVPRKAVFSYTDETAGNRTSLEMVQCLQHSRINLQVLYKVHKSVLRKVYINFEMQISICPVSRQSMYTFKAGGNLHQGNVKKGISLTEKRFSQRSKVFLNYLCRLACYWE